MSNITANIVVEPIDLTVQVEQPQITVTPQAPGLNVFLGGLAVVGGNVGELQFNNAGQLGGVSNTNFSAGNLSLGNVSNVKIGGGVNTYYLQTDGTGNLVWAPGLSGNVTGNGVPGGGVNQIQYNLDGANFGGSAGFTFDPSSNAFATPGAAGVGGNLTVGGNTSIVGTITADTVNANIFSGKLANGSTFVDIPAANGNIQIDVSGTSNVLVITNNGLFANDANIGNIAGTLTTASQPNITEVGTLTSANVVILRTISDKVALGLDAGLTGQGSFGVAVGTDAGFFNQRNNAVAIGRGAGRDTQGNSSIAIGTFAGNSSQHDNSIILNATGAVLESTGANRIFVKPVRANVGSDGLYYDATTGEITYGVINANTALTANYANFAGTVLTNAQPNITSVGTLTNLVVNGNITVTTGIFTGNGSGLSAIAGANVTGTVANANFATTAGTANFATTSGTANLATNANNATTAGTVTTNAQPNITSVGNLTSLTVTGSANIGNIRQTGSGIIVLGQLAASNSTPNANIIAIGYNSGNTSQGDNSIAIGVDAGINSTGFGAISIGLGAGANAANSSISIGQGATSVGSGSIALGSANAGANGVAVGTGAKANSSSISIGASAGGNAQGANSVAIGTQAALTGQGASSVAIGRFAGRENQTTESIAIGTFAGSNNQSGGAVAIGLQAGFSNQGLRSIAIGEFSANSSQGTEAIALGWFAGSSTQGNRSIALGLSAGQLNQGSNSIAIGASAASNAQANNSIAINATGVDLPANIANALFVKPIRDVTAEAGFTVALYYNPTTGEIGYK
jgi:hypothetical protein